MAGRHPRCPRWRLLLVTSLVGVLLLALGAQPAGAHDRVPRTAQLFATLSCRADGGADVGLIVRNVGSETLYIDDIHLELLVVRDGDPEGVGVLFVFPAPSHGVIPPGEQRTFRLGFGDQFSPEDPALDLSGDGLILAVDVYLVGRHDPVTRHFSFPACNG